MCFFCPFLLWLCRPPTEENLKAIVAQKNKQPLPSISENKYGIQLPSDDYCLTAANYQITDSEAKGGRQTTSGDKSWDTGNSRDGLGTDK